MSGCIQLNSAKTLVINVPVADLRRNPQERMVGFQRDLAQETQLLWGEPVQLLEERGDWLRVRALQQPTCRDGRWVGYPGWVRRSQVVDADENGSPPLAILWKPFMPFSAGVCLPWVGGAEESVEVRLPDGRLMTLPREAVLLPGQPPPSWEAIATLFLGMPYLWGGGRSHFEGSPDSVDCSSLVHLVYRIRGLTIPRDAHDQFLWGQPLPATELAPGDLVFRAPSDGRGRITHVMLYLGQDRLLEASMEAGQVRWNTGERYFGIRLTQLLWGQTIGRNRIYYTKINSSVKISF